MTRSAEPLERDPTTTTQRSDLGERYGEEQSLAIVTRTGAIDRTLSTGYRIVATREQPRPYSRISSGSSFVKRPREAGPPT
jgi:hypothetical protein